MSKHELYSTRDGFGHALLEQGRENKSVYVLSADLRDSLRVGDFAKGFPKRFIECGVAEQNMIGISAGLASEGKVPFATSFAVFSPGRTWEQIKISVCLNKLPVKVVGGYGGFSNYKDGATHQALEDIAITRVIPYLKVIIPADYLQAKQVVQASIKDKRPNYIRLSGETLPDFINEKIEFKIGKAQVLDSGEDAVIISYGPMLYHVLNAVKKSGIKATVINMHTIKPLDRSAILESLDYSRKIITVEDHQIRGGLGSAVAEVLSQSGIRHRLKIIGVKNKFGKSARNIEDMYKYFKLDEDSLAKKFTKFLDS